MAKDSSILIYGKRDQYGFFRFSSKNLLYYYYAYTVLQKIDGDFLFHKKVYDKVNNVTKSVVYVSSNYLTTEINSNLSILDIQTLLLKRDSVTHIVEKDHGVVIDSNVYKKIAKLSEKSFFKKYVTEHGLIREIKDEKEKVAVVLRLLSLNIPIAIGDISGDLTIPTYNVAIRK